MRIRSTHNHSVPCEPRQSDGVLSRCRSQCQARPAAARIQVEAGAVTGVLRMLRILIGKYRQTASTEAVSGPPCSAIRFSALSRRTIHYQSRKVESELGVIVARGKPKSVQISPGLARVLVCLAAAIVAGVDFLLPANINIATFYVVSIVLAGWTRSVRWLWISTAVFVLLTFGGLVLAPAPVVQAVTWIDWLNRTMTALALVVVAVPVHLRLRNLVSLERSIVEIKQAELQLQENRKLLERRVEERTAALARTADDLKKENASRIHVEQELRESERSLRELSTQLLHAQDEERRHIGRELHDGLGQCLAGLKLTLHFLEGAIPPNDQAARARYSECMELSDQAISQIRTLSHLMYPPLLEKMGLELAIPWYVRGFEQRSGIQTKLDMPENLQRLSQELELTLFRILQEALTNVHRHSGSHTAEVNLRLAEGAILLQVKDSGAGMKTQSAGVGLRSMQERAKQLGGTLEVASGAAGTTVTATLPCGAAQSASAS